MLNSRQWFRDSISRKHYFKCYFKRLKKKETKLSLQSLNVAHPWNSNVPYAVAESSVADPYHLDVDPDPAFQFHADPDLTTHFFQIWTLQCSKWLSKATTFSFRCGSCFSLWCGSWSRFPFWCGSETSLPKWCRSATLQNRHRIWIIFGSWIRIIKVNIQKV